MCIVCVCIYIYIYMYTSIGDLAGGRQDHRRGALDGDEGADPGAGLEDAVRLSLPASHT